MTALCWAVFALASLVASFAIGSAVGRIIAHADRPAPPLDLAPFILTGPADAAVNPEIHHG